MVAASSRAVSTPRVPLASSAQAAINPGCETLRPSRDVRGPVATNGSKAAKTTNGTSTTSRFSRYAAGTRAARMASRRAARWTAYGQVASRGVATTSRTKASAETILR